MAAQSIAIQDCYENNAIKKLQLGVQNKNARIFHSQYSNVHGGGTPSGGTELAAHLE